MTDKACSKCKTFKDLSLFSKNRTTKDGLHGWCKLCTDGYKKEWANRPKLEKTSKTSKTCTQCLLTMGVAKFNKDTHTKDGLHGCCKTCHNQRSAQWGKDNPDKNNAKSARRRATKRQAAVAWANKTAITAVYKAAMDATKLTGIPHHVDHEHPLKGDLVCGLHHEHNLVVEPASYNCSKSNKFLPYREHGFKLQVFYPKYVLVPGWTADDPDHPYGYFI